MTEPLNILVLALLMLPVAARGEQPKWYLTTATTADPNAQTRVRLDAEERTVDAGAGWACTVSRPSAVNGRTTTCRKGSEAFEFSVQCSARRSEDHVQIRFRGSEETRTFIEVGCRTGGPGGPDRG